jgi:UDP-glucose 4-epimerase
MTYLFSQQRRYSQMKALIIGANGFLGRFILSACLSRGWQVDAIYHRTRNFIPETCPALPITALDSCPNDYDVVFLVAATIPYGSFDSPGGALVDANVKLVLTTVDKFHKSKIVFASSVSVYGTPVNPLTEQSPFNCPSLYGLSKLAGEFIVSQQSRYAIIRYSSLYGKGMNRNTFIPVIIRQARETGVITLYGDGSRRQDYLHVADAAELAMTATLHEENGIYLGVRGESVTNLEVAQAVQSSFPASRIVFTGSDTSPSFIYDNAFTMEALNCRPLHSLTVGIKELCTNES